MEIETNWAEIEHEKEELENAMLDDRFDDNAEIDDMVRCEECQGWFPEKKLCSVALKYEGGVETKRVCRSCYYWYGKTEVL